MNNSKDSSFNAFDYFKKLTKCVAMKKNYKFDLKHIAGYENSTQRNSKPTITKEYMQAQILAKCNDRSNRLASEKLKKADATSGNGSKGSLNENKTEKNNFVVKFQETKKKKKEEPYINLPPSFFKPFNVQSDMSLFKIPKALPPKKRPTENKTNHPNPPPPASSFLDSTLNSLTSINFNPNVASTPIEEKKKPMFSEPAELESYFTALKQKAPEDVPFNFDDEAKEVTEIVSNAAKRIDSTCFAAHFDPIIDIHGRIMEIYEASCRSPRLMNETLISSKCFAQHSEQFPSVVSSVPIVSLSKYVLPDQAVFEEIELVDDARDEDGCLPNNTQDLFDWTHSEPMLESSASRWSQTFTVKNPVHNFGQMNPNMPQACQPNEDTLDKLFSQDMFELDFGTTKEADDDPFEFSPDHVDPFDLSPEFSNPFDEILMDWETPEDLPIPMDNSFAVFRSPPVSRKSQSRTSQRYESQLKSSHPSQASRRSHKSSHASRRRRSHKSRHSQNIESANKESESTMSTYVWTPKFKLSSPQKELNEVENYFLEPRKIFKNSFNFF